MEGCESAYSTVHECRARACSAHCAALYVTLETDTDGEQSRFCYQVRCVCLVKKKAEKFNIK